MVKRFRSCGGRNLPIPIDLAIGLSTACTFVQAVVIPAAITLWKSMPVGLLMLRLNVFLHCILLCICVNCVNCEISFLSFWKWNNKLHAISPPICSPNFMKIHPCVFGVPCCQISRQTASCTEVVGTRVACVSVCVVECRECDSVLMFVDE